MSKRTGDVEITKGELAGDHFKLVDVIASCQTLEQLESARRYVALWALKNVDHPAGPKITLEAGYLWGMRRHAILNRKGTEKCENQNPKP